jgi:hypothetical protein
MNPRCSVLLLVAVIAHPLLVRAGEPKLDHLFPAGGGRGQQVTVTLSGSFEHWPVRVWASEPGVAFEPGQEKGKLTARIAPGARPGLSLIRVYDDEGASAPRPFVVGTLPETEEREPNDEPAKSQKVERLPVVLNGRLGKRGDVDVFEVELRKGQTLAAALEAHHRLGSPMDGVLQLVSREGFVLEQVDDSPDLDPHLRFDVPADGRYGVRVFAFPSKPDSSIALAGGPAFDYRLTLTTSGYLERSLPLAIESGKKPSIVALGTGLPADLGNLCVELAEGKDCARAWHPRLGGDLDLPVVGYPCLVEEEHGPGAQVQGVPVPSCVTGRIGRDDDQDRFRVTLKKGEPCRFRVESRALGSPLDPILRVSDTGGEVLVEQDDTSGRDAEINFTAPRDGAFDAVVADLNGRGGPDFVYLLSMTHPEPDFALEAADDPIRLATGKSAELTVKVSRRDGFASPIEVEATGLPAGVAARAVRSETTGDSAATVKLKLEAAPGAKPSSTPFQIDGRAKAVRKFARTSVAGIEAGTDQLWLTVIPSAKP